MEKNSVLHAKAAPTSTDLLEKLTAAETKIKVLEQLVDFSSPSSTSPQDSDITISKKENSSGGIRFDLLLSPPVSCIPVLTASPNPPLTVEFLEEKIEQARLRKKSMEAEKLITFVAKKDKIQDIAKKRAELDEAYMESAKQALETKLETTREKREALIQEKKDRAKSINEHVESVRQKMQAQLEELMISIQVKVKNANEAREAQIAALLERLEKHDRHQAEIRKNNQESVELLKEKYQSKLESHTEKREAILKMLKEKQSEHLKKAEEIRLKAESLKGMKKREEQEEKRDEEKSETNIRRTTASHDLETSPEDDDEEYDALRNPEGQQDDGSLPE